MSIEKQRQTPSQFILLFSYGKHPEKLNFRLHFRSAKAPFLLLVLKTPTIKIEL